MKTKIYWDKDGIPRGLNATPKVMKEVEYIFLDQNRIRHLIEGGLENILTKYGVNTIHLLPESEWKEALDSNLNEVTVVARSKDGTIIALFPSGIDALRSLLSESPF